MGKGGEVEKRKGKKWGRPLPFLYLPSFTHSLPLLCQKWGRNGRASPSIPSSFLPLPFLYLPSFTHSLPLLLDVGPLKPAGSLGSFPGRAKNELDVGSRNTASINCCLHPLMNVWKVTDNISCRNVNIHYAGGADYHSNTRYKHAASQEKNIYRPRLDTPPSKFYSLTNLVHYAVLDVFVWLIGLSLHCRSIWQYFHKDIKVSKLNFPVSDFADRHTQTSTTGTSIYALMS